LSWYFFILFFRYAWGTSDKKWGTLNTLPLGQSKSGWGNIFYGGPHWRFYCNWGPHARITYITSVIALKTSKKFYMNYHKMKVTTVTSGWVKMRFQMKRVVKNLIILI